MNSNGAYGARRQTPHSPGPRVLGRPVEYQPPEARPSRPSPAAVGPETEENKQKRTVVGITVHPLNKEMNGLIEEIIELATDLNGLQSTQSNLGARIESVAAVKQAC